MTTSFFLAAIPCGERACSPRLGAFSESNSQFRYYSETPQPWQAWRAQSKRRAQRVILHRTGPFLGGCLAQLSRGGSVAVPPFFRPRSNDYGFLPNWIRETSPITKVRHTG